MPSAALTNWHTDRSSRLSAVESHCNAVVATVPLNATFADETLRGFVLHLSAHFQGFCRDLYTECSQIWIAALQPGFQATAQAQFSVELALERGNPSYNNIKRDFNRFGLQLENANLAVPQQLTDLHHLSVWRNKAAHQGTKPLGGGVPTVLTLPLVQGWRVSGDGPAISLDGIMHAELLRIMGAAPWQGPNRSHLQMATENAVEPLKDGTIVKILNSGYARARIAEYRGPLGPKGARIYRVLVQEKPRHVYIEVREDQLEVLS